MITEPPIIFCDEPTTGLDSFNAKIVISALRDLTGNKIAITFLLHMKQLIKL